MNKAEMITLMSEKAGITKKAAEAALEAFVEGVETTLKTDGEVTIFGFGKFSVVKRAARTGRNPQTGKAIEVKAKRAPKFTPGKGLRDAI